MKLLKRILKSYLIYSALILIISIPLSYFITRALCLQDVDEALYDRKMEMKMQVQTQQKMLQDLPWKDFTKNTIIYPPVSEVKPDKKVNTTRYNKVSDEKEPYRELHSFIHINGRNYPVTLRISLIDIEDLIQGVVLTSTLLIILILGGLFLINRQQSKRVWRPFYEILERLKAFNIEQKPDFRFTATDISEFEELQQAIVLLAERVYTTYLQQKEFTGNAAHELQTPLASIQAKIEVLVQDEALTETQAEYLQSMQDIIIKTTRLNKALLLLTRIDNRQFMEQEEMKFPLVIKELLHQFRESLVLKDIAVETDFRDFTLKGNATLVRVLLSNLLSNALRYTPSHGHLQITASSYVVEMKNEGLPLPFPKEKLFLRFQKGNHLEASGGNGLGLAIVKKICDICHYSIDYQYTDNQWHCFRVELNIYS